MCYVRKICIFFSKVMQNLLINNMYVNCIMHDLCISFPKNVGKISKEYAKDKQEENKIRRDKGKR